MRWQGKQIDLSLPLPVALTQSILWELHEINFRWELIALDRYCYKLRPALTGDEHDDELAASTPAEREMLIMGFIPHFSGNLVPDMEDAGAGFASVVLEERRDALVAWYRVMQGWSDYGTMATDTAKLSKRVAEEKCSVQDVDALGHLLVYYYVSMFREIFNRAPVLPHRL